jgi:dihydrofolate reductase
MKTVLSGPEQRDFAAAWRRQPKWVVSRSLKSVGPNATLVEGDIEAVIRGLKAQLVGEIQVAGPDIARSLTDLGHIDEYRLYFRPAVLGRGKPFFAGPGRRFALWPTIELARTRLD